MTLSADGDLFEKENEQWLIQNLPCYSSIWSSYVGNDGKNQPKPKYLVRAECATDHQLFAQAHYTLAISAFRLDRLATQITDKILQRGAIKTSEDFFGDIEAYFLFMGYVGNIRDQLDRIQDILKAQIGVKEHLQEFYNQRSHVLHGPRIPVLNDGFELRVPMLGGEIEKEGEWTRLVPWNSIPEKNFIPMSKFCEDLRDKLFERIRLLHPKIEGPLRCFFDLTASISEAPHSFSNYTGDFVTAGSASYSVSRLPSGSGDTPVVTIKISGQRI